MARYKKNPRYHVISIRVSDLELEALERLSREANTSVANMMREALLIADVPQTNESQENYPNEQEIRSA